MNCEIGELWVGVTLRNVVMSIDFVVINVYAPQELKEKQIFRFSLNSVLSHCEFNNLPVLIMGDFNFTRRQGDSSNSSNNKGHKIRKFCNSWIKDNNLIEIHPVNAIFTWTGLQRRRSRIDRAFGSDAWMSSLEWNLKALHRYRSDHKQLFLAVKDKNWGPKSFRNFNIWLKNEKIKKSLVERLKEVQSKGNRNIHEKLRSLKEEIKNWNKNQNGNIFIKIAEVKKG